MNEDIINAVLNEYRRRLKQYRALAAGRGCTSSRDFLQGRITQIKEILLLIGGEDIREKMREVEEG